MDFGRFNKETFGAWHFGPGNSVQPWRAIADPINELPAYLHDTAGIYESPVGYILPSQADKQLVRRLQRNYPLMNKKMKRASAVAHAWFQIKNLGMEEEAMNIHKNENKKSGMEIGDAFPDVVPMLPKDKETGHIGADPGVAGLANAMAMARAFANVNKPARRGRRRYAAKPRRYIKTYRRPTYKRRTYRPTYRRRTTYRRRRYY